MRLFLSSSLQLLFWEIIVIFIWIIIRVFSARRNRLHHYLKICFFSKCFIHITYFENKCIEYKIVGSQNTLSQNWSWNMLSQFLCQICIQFKTHCFINCKNPKVNILMHKIAFSGLMVYAYKKLVKRIKIR